MDARLQHCFEKALPPFDGNTVYLSGDLPLERPRALTRAVHGVLESACPTSPLFLQDDWHEHDGCIFPASPSLWPTIRGHVSSTENFLYLKTGDFAVAKGHYTKERNSYFRIILDEDCTAEKGEGTLDVTVSAHLESAAVQAFEESGPRPLRQPARAFFTERAAE